MQGVPDWLAKWTAYTLQYILFEERVYPLEFNDKNSQYPMEALQLDAKNIRDGKIQNVAITLDKVKHVLERMGTEKAPLRMLTVWEVYERMWEGGDSSRA